MDFLNKIESDGKTRDQDCFEDIVPPVEWMRTRREKYDACHQWTEESPEPSALNQKTRS